MRCRNIYGDHPIAYPISSVCFMISLLSTLLLATAVDQNFHCWCEKVGIETPHAQLLTTNKSVAGRGVFATRDVAEGDVVITIPEEIVLHEFNAAVSFPRLSKRLTKAKKKFLHRNRWWRRLFNFRGRKVYEFTEEEDLWQGIMTAYSLAVLQEDPDRLWKPWISQWARSDPMQTAFDRGLTWRDQDEVVDCVEKLSAMAPSFNHYKLRAGVEMRLGRLEDLSNILGLTSFPDSSRMFGLLTSRAIELGSGIVGVLPMYDMVNHSEQPNLGLSFDGERFSMFALRKISDGEEFFVSYSSKESVVTENENNALWMLVQWGIPPSVAETSPVPETVS